MLLAAQEQPAVIFVDMQMDEMEGTDFVREVRRSPEISHLPVLVCTVGSGKNDEERARQAGADGFVQRPFDLNQLSQAIKQYSTRAT